MPPSVAAFIYTVLLKTRPLRALAERLIRRMIPSEIPIRGVTLILNQRDAIVSGNLALGCYEVSNLDIFESMLRPRMCVFDVGANIGLYSAVAAKSVGPQGRVVAIEPDKSNCSFIERTVLRNSFDNLTVVQKAAGDECKQTSLFLCATNKADHRVYDLTGDRAVLPILMTTIDQVTADLGIESVDLMKIDTQGAEPLVFDGMQEMLRRSPGIKIIMEFWPWGIAQAGRSPSDFLQLIVGSGFSVSEIDGSRSTLRPVRDLDSILGLTLERQHADLYLERAS